jgi:hypothetical protein
MKTYLLILNGLIKTTDTVDDYVNGSKFDTDSGANPDLFLQM